MLMIVQALSLPHPERRSSERFPMERDVRYRVADGRNTLWSGAGKTVDISSRGILFTTERPLTANKRLELSVDWPVRLDNGCPLKLVAQGRVVRAEDARAALMIEKYEFRTQGAKPFSLREETRLEAVDTRRG